MASEDKRDDRITMADLRKLEDRVADHIVNCPVRQDAKDLSERIASLERTIENGINSVIEELHNDVREIRSYQMKIIFWVLGGVSSITAIALTLNRIL